MDYDDPEVQQLFFALHDGLPREGPGSRACTARALAMAGALPAAARVLDIACGPGMQTMDLAALLPDAGIVALDNHAPFLAELERRAVERGVDGRVTTLRADMAAIPCPPGSFDLIWVRMQARQGHYMKASMLQSQFDTLELPSPNEATTIPADEDVETILDIICTRRRLGE